MILLTENYLNSLSNKIGNLNTNQKMGVGALTAGGLTAAGLGYMGHELSSEMDDFDDKLGYIQKSPTLEIQAGALEGLHDGSTKLKDVLTNKTNIFRGDQSISLADVKDQFVTSGKLNSLKTAAPGIIAGAGAIGAIGARIGAQQPKR